jgi:hypothetical protein
VVESAAVIAAATIKSSKRRTVRDNQQRIVNDASKRARTPSSNSSAKTTAASEYDCASVSRQAYGGPGIKLVELWGMKYDIKIARLCILPMCLLSLARATDDNQSVITTTKIQGDIPSKTATIVNYSVDTTDPDAYVATGNLSIQYSDGTKVIVKIPPRRKSTDNETIFNEVGFNDIKILGDKRTIGWSELFENCCTSYPIPEVLAIYGSGKVITHIRQGQMLWDWTFLDGAKHIAVIWGLAHGTSIGDYQLYDVKRGEMLSEFIKDTEDRSQRPDIPTWVHDTDKKVLSHTIKRKQ